MMRRVCVAAQATTTARVMMLPSSLLYVAQRPKASTMRIANRKKVEMFMGKRFHLPTRLRTAAPDIAAEWNHERNPKHLYPEIVGVGHMDKVWWTCASCKTDYEMSVEKRVVRGGGCPHCTATASADNTHLLEGEQNPALRPKRPMMLNIRTKY